jgi:hypothetical protein
MQRDRSPGAKPFVNRRPGFKPLTRHQRYQGVSLEPLQGLWHKQRHKQLRKVILRASSPQILLTCKEKKKREDPRHHCPGVGSN